MLFFLLWINWYFVFVLLDPALSTQVRCLLTYDSLFLFVSKCLFGRSNFPITTEKRRLLVISQEQVVVGNHFPFFFETNCSVETNSTEKSPLWEAISHSADRKKLATFYGTQRFITVFTGARHWSLSWTRCIHCNSILGIPVAFRFTLQTIHSIPKMYFGVFSHLPFDFPSCHRVMPKWFHYPDKTRAVIAQSA
jgi:hypothetical protein